MERVQAPQTPFEVYCSHCSVTFPVGTRRCIHCGQPIGGRPLLVAARIPHELPGDEEAAAEFGVGRRLGGLALWMLLALGAAIARICSD